MRLYTSKEIQNIILNKWGIENRLYYQVSASNPTTYDLVYKGLKNGTLILLNKADLISFRETTLNPNPLAQQAIEENTKLADSKVASIQAGTAIEIDNSTPTEPKVSFSGNLITDDEKAALDAANNPSALNPYATINDLPSGGGTVTSIGTSAPLTGGTITTSGTIGITEANASTDGYLSSVDWNIFNNKQNSLGYTPENIANKGMANGYVPLNASTKIDLTYFPDAILGQVLYGGLVDISTAVATLTTNAKNKLGTLLSTITLTNNTAALTGYGANEGIYYIASVGGNFAGISFDVGDWLISIGTAWKKVDNTDAVVSVNGQTGVVTLTTSDISEGINLYFTNARAIASLLTGYVSGAGTISSSDSVLQAIQKLNGNISALVSGVSSVFSRTGAVTAQSGDYNTSQVTESGNLYFTNARAIASTLTGYTSGAGTISSSDSILQAIQKLNGNIAALVTGVSSVNSQTGVVTLTTTNISEGTNLYYTNARGIASTLTGYTSGAGTISATDTILQAIQKLNGNITALVTGVSSVNGQTGSVTISSISGNAGTATTLQTARQINGISFNGSADINVNMDINLYAALGSTLKAQNFTIDAITTGSNLVNGRFELFALWLNKGETLTGAILYQLTQGAFVANNENRIGLYTYSGGTCTLVASTANDGNLWQTVANGYVSKAFSSTYVAASGLYFVGIISNWSSVTTTPTIGTRTNTTNPSTTAFNFTNNARLVGFIGSQNTLPSSFNMSSVTGQNLVRYVGLY